ncbi:MAG: PDDEXK nuclease domain-containing protein [Eggerthellaceae bacterium]|nr:PDDEXK nuclease domain-containing protein [Eggerthellaceae bacterium]
MGDLAKQGSAALLPEGFYQQVSSILNAARNRAYAAVNFAMVEAYWEIGKSIVEQQGGEERAEYGEALLEGLSARLTEDFGKGFDIRNLRFMRQFYLAFPIRNALRTELSWTHYRRLSRIPDAEAREWYMNECAESHWSTRQLERQINTMFRERLLASRDKETVAAEISKTAPPKRPEDIIRDPYVLEFLGFSDDAAFRESDLEQALITHLQRFLLELGRGFAFEARQKRITFDGRHFYIDLVFYNYLMRCFVLIDLKMGDLTHQDLGQMQMYVNYYTRELMNEGDNPPIGIVLCADKSDSIVEYTLPEGNDQVFAAKYLPYLPSKEELAAELSAEYRALDEAAEED